MSEESKNRKEKHISKQGNVKSTQGKSFKTLNELIEESKNPESKSLKQEIDRITGERRALIKELKASERFFSYKVEEGNAIEKLLSTHQKELEESKRAIGRLKYMKRSLEFAIETEASSLKKERALIRKIKETNTKLDEALMLVKLERKMNNIKRDVETYRSKVSDMIKKIHEYDAKLDELYARLRTILNIKRKREQRHTRRERPQAKPMPIINLEDIAVIKKKREG